MQNPKFPPLQTSHSNLTTPNLARNDHLIGYKYQQKTARGDHIRP